MREFKLNMQSLYEELLNYYPDILYFFAEDNLTRAYLKSFRLYSPGKKTAPGFVYITASSLLKDASPDPVSLYPDSQGHDTNLEDIGFIICGKMDLSAFPFRCPLLLLEDEDALFSVVTRIQEFFAFYLPWPQKLTNALNTSFPLDEILGASLPVFRNPIFIHDPNFFILSCPHRAPGMLEWERDSRTNWDIVPLSVTHEFKVQAEYLDTLSVTRPAIYSPESWDYPILYMNLWNNNHYEGRICVDELETPIKTADFLAIEYLADFILETMHHRNQLWLNANNNMEQFFLDYLSGKVKDPSGVTRNLYLLGWNRTDSYLCLRLEAEQQDIRMISAGTLGHIETQIPYCHALLYENGISVIVNLTYSRLNAQDVVSSLAILLREGLLKMGCSLVFHDFMLLAYGHYQAKMALQLGKRSTSMSWYHVFDDYLLEFLLTKAGEALPPELLCSRKLMALRQYDEENHTELYRTLKIFLELERNVLQTAKTLFVHRSTLFYRLERIRKIAGLDLENPKERLTLLISFQILEAGTAGHT